jgi:hypothetical protein
MVRYFWNFVPLCIILYATVPQSTVKYNKGTVLTLRRFFRCLFCINQAYTGSQRMRPLNDFDSYPQIFSDIQNYDHPSSTSLQYLAWDSTPTESMRSETLCQLSQRRMFKILKMNHLEDNTGQYYLTLLWPSPCGDYLRIDSIRTGVLLVGIDSRLEDKPRQRKVTVQWHPKPSLEALKGQSKIITMKLSKRGRSTRKQPFFETYSTVTESTWRVLWISSRKQLYVRNKCRVWITGPGGIVSWRKSRSKHLMHVSL